MENERQVERLLSVFNLTIHECLRLPERVCTGVLFLYDKGENMKEFTVLNKDIAADVSSRIASWLEENLDATDFAAALKSNTLDADALTKKI
jgi:hypothetical protein